ncbi:hypothetical protein OSTOST_10885, partial [Ostertagia ostertagi]
MVHCWTMSPAIFSSTQYAFPPLRPYTRIGERLAVCIQNREPVLLVGETGVGKTSIVQSLASAVNASLKVVNLTPSSDTDELISGQVGKRRQILHDSKPLHQLLPDIFPVPLMSSKNQKFLSHLEACLSSGRYRDYLSVAIATAEKALSKQSKKKDPRWASVIVRGKRIRESLENGAALFAVCRGAVLEAAQEGYWLLIDEINLAPPESLDAIVHAILGNVHPNFRLFACMNPATDAGKRRLPASVRTRFTEFYVPEMTDAHQIALVVSAYLPSMKSIAVSNLSAHTMPCFNVRSREYICMAFLTNLDAVAKEKMRVKIAQTFRVATNIPVPPPNGKAENYVSVEGYWIERGAELTSYMGSYVGDSNGRLVFREGALVKAVRNGSWLLDDNRELYVPETNAVIKAHPRFRLFATQNPAGSYGGRKRLSRALMSRFIVLRFNNIPLDELSSMVCVRCGVHPSAATKMINVLSKLRVKRSITGVFSAKDGLMTLRDVFRWAKRLATDSSCDDWLQVLTNHGYFLLAGRCRNQKDVAAVVETLEAELKRKIDKGQLNTIRFVCTHYYFQPSKLFAMNSPYMPTNIDAKGIVMTLGMRRMLVMTEQ